MKIITKILYALKEIIFDKYFGLLAILGIYNLFQPFFSGYNEIKYLIYIFIIAFILSSLKIIINKERKINNLKNKASDSDIVLFKKITEEILPKNETIYFLKYRPFRAGYFCSQRQSLEKFENYCNDRPDFFFRDNDLEKVKNELKKSIRIFLNFDSTETFRVDNSERLAVPIEWKHSFKKEVADHYYRSVDKLDDLSLKISNEYDNFLKIGSKKLSLPFKE